ncbi:hypothetical protein NEMIN01_1065 [Nematocida minor]|uniref:uncharacterized protein n=1 Tax=Nematocida minor TaxID=1912983 RepID=UPI0022210E03|nr:uncharacterized protein NEMIN01_1065 [Nematocida minor]KAI5190527.1 hypothetical protein NEMIN01_1065 [Nematocida minor]
MSRKEKTSLIQMLNTSIGNISGLFKTKKEEAGEKEHEEVEIEEITPSQEKEENESFLLDEEEEFEKDLSRLSVSVEEEDSHNMLKIENKTETKNILSEDSVSRDEINRLKKIIALKDEIRQKEREKDQEKTELGILERIKIQAELDYQRKRKKMLMQVIESLQKSLEESEIQRLELMRYCKLLIEQEERSLPDKKR